MRTSAASLPRELFLGNGSVDLAGAGKTQEEFGRHQAHRGVEANMDDPEYGVSKDVFYPATTYFPKSLPGSDEN